jgi:PAS domain S-box-containing protein
MKLNKITKPAGDFWRSLEKRMLPASAWSSDPFIFWQERILLMICITAVVFGPIALIPSVWLSLQEGLFNIVILDTLSYGAVVTVLIFRNLAFHFRSGVIFAVLYMLGVGLLMVLGPVGAGYIWLLGASILISTIYDIKAVYFTLVCNTLIFLFIAGCIVADVLKWPVLMDNPLEKWLVMMFNFLLINAFVTITTAMMLRSLKSHFRKEQEMRLILEESESRLHEVFNSVENIPVQGYDRNRRVIFWNRASESVYGYSLDEALGKHLEDLIVPDEMRQGVIEGIAEWQENGVRIPAAELTLKNKKNEPVFVYSDHVMITNQNGEKELFCIDLDLSELKRLEKEKALVEKQYQQAQKMESIGRLAGGVAHDFNNMLSVIIGYTELAMKKTGPSAKMYPDLRQILSAAERSAGITRQLLAFARKQTIKPKVLDLNNIVGSMLKMIRRLIGEDIDLSWQPEKRMCPIEIDPSQLEQIIINLCVNARDAISGVGKVAIGTNTVIIDRDYSNEHIGFIPGEFVVLSVSDSGCGMDKPTLENIFEPFFTTKGENQGTGLGLATVYGIIKQNNGFINVYSEPGDGTTFKLYFPRHAGTSVKIEAEPTTVNYTSRNEVVLLVEDEPEVKEMSMAMLEELGYKVFAEGSPNDAIQLAEEHAGTFDLLITDVVMPGMNGRELERCLRTLYPDIKVLFMSGYTADVIAHRGVLDDGVQFIQKPFLLNDLGTKIREIMDDGADFRSKQAY